MTHEEKQLEKIKNSFCVNAELQDLEGQIVVFLPLMQFESSCGWQEMNLLFVPRQHLGIVRALYYSEEITGSAKNWSVHNFSCGVWHKPSYSKVDDSICWRDQIIHFLRAVK